MSASEKNLPPTLWKRLTDDTEIFIFDAWFGTYWATIMGSSVALSHVDCDIRQAIPSLDNSDLRAAVKRYIDEQPDEEFWKTLESGSCSWAQVLDELDEATRFYKEKGNKNFIRQSFRHGAGVSRNVLPLLEGIPQDNGLGLLKGGLKIIFHAVKRRSEACEKTFEAFQRIPSSIIHAEKLRRIFVKEEELYVRVKALSDELVKCIPALINILLRKGSDSALKKLGKAVFRDSVIEVETILKPMKIAEDRLESCRQLLDTRGILENTNVSRETLAGVQIVSRSVVDVGQRLESIETKLESWKSSINQERQLNREALRNFVQVKEEVSLIYNSMYMMFQESARIRSFYSSSYDIVAYPPTQFGWTREKLMEAICTEGERVSPTRDLGIIFQKYHSFGVKELAQANYILSTKEFHKWLVDTDSDILLVDGHCRGAGIGKVSPVSVFCASLIETFSRLSSTKDFSPSQTPRIVLSFFCGQHTTQGDVLYGPEGLIRSLIDQVLLEWPNDHDPPNLEFLGDCYTPWPNNGCVFDVARLCYIFQTLLGQLKPGAPVYCIVDGISHFETGLQNWDDYARILVQCFLECVMRTDDADYRTPTFKFLLTSPDKSTIIRNIVPPNHHVDLRAGNLHSHSFQTFLYEITQQLQSQNMIGYSAERPIHPGHSVSDPAGMFLKHSTLPRPHRQSSTHTMPEIMVEPMLDSL